MDGPPPDFRTLSYSTMEAPPRDRLEIWRELIGRWLVKMKVDPVSDAPYRADVKLRALPELRVAIGDVDASINRRDHAVSAAESDDLMLVVTWTETLSCRSATASSRWRRATAT